LFRRAVLALAFLNIFGSPRPGYALAKSSPDGGPPKTTAKATAKATVKAPTKADKKQKKLSRYAPVELFEVNTKETLKLRFHDDRGRPIKGWKKRFDRFMRCHQTGTVFNMDSRLPHMLYEVGRHYEGHRLEVVSGYRHPKVARNPKSPHKQGLACDFRVAGIPNTNLRDYLRKTFSHAGVGYYPNSVFVHLDNRKNGPAAFWIDYSGPGQAAFYAENPNEDLRTGRAERTHVTGQDGEGHAEGSDDVAQAGAAIAAGKVAGKPAQASPPKPPLEVKNPRDPFGD
jgi:uncharacterized protein YcbK (DUF882 family)